MANKFQPGDPVFFIQSGRYIREGTCLREASGFVTVTFAVNSFESGGIRLRNTKCYKTVDEAKAHVSGTPVIEEEPHGQTNRAVELH